MCCDPMNDNPEVDECPDCGGPIDVDGDSTDVCPFSPIDCDTCGAQPCDQAC